MTSEATADSMDLVTAQVIEYKIRRRVLDLSALRDGFDILVTSSVSVGISNSPLLSAPYSQTYTVVAQS